MPDGINISSPLLAAGIGAFVFLAVSLALSLQKIQDLRDSLTRLMLSFNELDEQAKLIVRTDLELNKAQEDLDKRLVALDALQKISRQISTTLDETEIFQRLNQPLVTELGFQIFLVLLFGSKDRLQPCVNFGFTEEDSQRIIGFLESDAALIKQLKERLLISSASASSELRGRVDNALNLKNYVLSPILAQQDMPGIIIAGNQSETLAITAGDEELISILSDQLGQAVRNARMFENVYRSSQMLEVKVQERTRELTSTLEELQKISKAKSEFISAVSHELRTPLTSIKGYASILITGKVGDIPGQVKERLEKINKHSDNLVQLINNLLDISRIESGRAEMKFISTPLQSVADSVLDLLAPQLKEKNIHAVTAIPADLPAVMIDVNQIERALINLVGNAIKFTAAEGTITISAESDETKATVLVRDTGIGMKAEDLNKLFSEFYRVDNEINQTVKGSGLGLALTKKIVEAHGGRIWVASEVNQGTAFSFTLPFEQKTGPAAAS